MFPVLPELRQMTSPPVALFSVDWRLAALIVVVQDFGLRPVQFGVEP
jgi:hypothetical protein